MLEVLRKTVYLNILIDFLTLIIRINEIIMIKRKTAKTNLDFKTLEKLYVDITSV